MSKRRKTTESTSNAVEPESIVPATRGARRREAVPEWTPWAVVGGVIVAGAGGSLALAHSGRSGGTHAETAPSVAAASATPAAPAARPSAGPSGSSSWSGAISVLHLVVTDQDSIMGKSLKITRTKTQAKTLAEELLARAKKGEDFAQLVSQYSEEPRTDQTHGVLANFRRKDAIPSFADAAFKLEVGELSDVVDTPYGYMLILRTK